MNVMPGLAARLPPPVLLALRHAQEIPPRASIALSIVRTILHDAYREAVEREGLCEGTVDAVREQVGYVLDALQDELDGVAKSVRELGVLPELD